MLEWIRFGIVAFCFLAGTVFLCISLAGTFRFGYSLSRIHASAMCDTLVLMFFITGCIVASGINIASFKFFLVLAIQWCSSPLVAHIFVKAKHLTAGNPGIDRGRKEKDSVLSDKELEKEGD